MNTSKLFLVKNLLPVIIVLLVFFNVIFIPSALSQRAATNIGFYAENQIEQFTEGQLVKFFGFVNYHTSEGAVAVQNEYYQIINKDTGTVIHTGYTDYKGTFEFSWTAESDTKQVNLQAIFPGSGQYPSAESKTLELEIFSQSKETYYDTYLTLEVNKGSTAGSIQVYPQLTSRGNNLDTNDIIIFVNGIKKATVSSNQWSEDIFTDTGLHKIRAENPGGDDDNEPLVFYQSSSDEKSYTVSGGGGGGSETYYDTSLTLQVEDAYDGVAVIYPQLTDSSGVGINTDNIEISVDGKYYKSVSSNQKSWITTGTGSHTIRADIDEFYFTSNPSIVYRSSSDEVSRTISGSQPPSDGSIVIVALIIVGAVGAGIGIALSKRKKKIPLIIVKQPPLTKLDDTQFWVCPHCGKDTEVYYGKQYCRNCKVYL